MSSVAKAAPSKAAGGKAAGGLTLDYTACGGDTDAALKVAHAAFPDMGLGPVKDSSWERNAGKGSRGCGGEGGLSVYRGRRVTGD